MNVCSPACAGVFLLLGVVTASGLSAEPVSARLLPQETLAYVCISNASELTSRLRQTAMGRVMEDEQMRPFVKHLYGSASEAFAQIQDRIGGTLDELLQVVRGEIALAVVAAELPEGAEGPPQSPLQLVVFADVDDRLPLAERFLDSVGDRLVANGAARSRTEAGATTITAIDSPGEPRQLAYFARDKMLVLASHRDLLKQVLAVWNGKGEAKLLADDRRYLAVMSKCVRSGGEEPLIRWYLNPVKLAIRATGQQPMANSILVLLEKHGGLSEVQVVGGTAMFATEEFDSVFQAHLLLGRRTMGAMNVLALGSGETTPEPWAPPDATGYMTLHWDFAKTYDAAAMLFDAFRGEGAWQREYAIPLGERLDLDVRKEVVAALAGRVSLVSWVERPVRVNSQAALFGLKLKNADQFRSVLDRVAGRFAGQLVRDSHGQYAFYRTPEGAAADGRRRRTDDSAPRILPVRVGGLPGGFG